MTIINVMVDDQRLEFSSMPVVASEGVKETYVKFALSSDWSGFGATALFYRDDSPEDVYTSVLDGAGLAEVPYEITAAPGWIRFGLSGSDGTSVHTSEILKYKVVKGKYTSGRSSEPPAPGIYEQMLAIAGQMRDTLNASIIEQNAIIQGLVTDMDDLRSDMETEQTTFESVVTGQINTLVNNFAGSSRETVLYSGSHQVNIGNEIDLVSSPTVYDYLDIVLNDGLIGTIIGPAQNSQWRVTGETIKSTGASVTTYVVEGVLDGNTLRVTESAAIVDTGTASTRYDLEDGPLADESLRRYCLKVIGRKLTDDAEVLNIRVGADGVTYQTAGTAVRSQLDKKLNAPIAGGTVDYGTSGQLLATDGQGNTEWVDSVIPDGSITVAKLAPGVIDTTYLIQGAAAESVTVGQSLASKASAADVTALDTRMTVVEDDIDDINDRLNTIATGDPINVYPAFHLGYVHGLPSFTPQEPAHNSSNDFVCTTDYISVADAKKLYFDSTNYQLCVVYYDASKVYQTFKSPTTTPNPYVLDTQYAYCVVELRKSDRSAFSEIDIANANGTVYYIEEIEADIVRHAELANAVSGIETEISGLATKKKIQPDFFPTLPYDVYRTISGYTCETPLDDLTGDWVTVYCDSANGNDENDGTLGHPVKTLTQADLYARRQMANNNKQVIIQIANNSVFYIDDIPASNDASKSLIMRADTKATIFAGKKPTFTASSSHYVSEELTGYTIIGCVDTSETDDYGLFKPMVAVSSESDVDATENSYYIDSTNKIVYVHPKTSIDDIVVIFSNKYAVNPAGRKFATSSFFYYENLIFVGNSTATGRLTDTVGETVQRSLFFKNCVFQHGFSNNCVSFNDWESAYIIGCTAGYAKFDCFNYHYTRKPTPTDAIAVEIDCRAKEAGYYNSTSGYSDNLTTCHEGANILRCGSHGYNGNGGMCADVNGCYTACLDCTYVNTSYADTQGRNRPAFFFNDDLGTRNGKTLLQNCYGYDSRNNKMVSAVDLVLSGMNAGGAIEASAIKVGKELI